MSQGGRDEFKTQRNPLKSGGDTETRARAAVSQGVPSRWWHTCLDISGSSSALPKGHRDSGWPERTPGSPNPAHLQDGACAQHKSFFLQVCAIIFQICANAESGSTRQGHRTHCDRPHLCMFSSRLEQTQPLICIHSLSVSSLQTGSLAGGQEYEICTETDGTEKPPGPQFRPVKTGPRLMLKVRAYSRGKRSFCRNWFVRHHLFPLGTIFCLSLLASGTRSPQSLNLLFGPPRTSA